MATIEQPAAGSHASRLAPPDRSGFWRYLPARPDPERPRIGFCRRTVAVEEAGTRAWMPFAYYDAGCCSWKAFTSPGGENSAAYAGVWPCAGVVLGRQALKLPALLRREARTVGAVLLPTPTACNPNDGESLESWQARRQRNLAKRVNGNGQGTPLSIAVRLLPQR